MGTAELKDGSVTSAKLANNAVTVSKLNSSVVDPDGGLALNADGLAIGNSIVAGSFAGITYDEHGSITAVDPDGTGTFPVASLPTATETTKGVVSVPTTGGISVSGDGELFTPTPWQLARLQELATTVMAISPRLAPTVKCLPHLFLLLDQLLGGWWCLCSRSKLSFCWR